jgi:hypothetical protein
MLAARKALTRYAEEAVLLVPIWEKNLVPRGSVGVDVPLAIAFARQ